MAGRDDALTRSLEVLKGAENYNRWIFDNIRPFIGKNVLEIGCGTGNLAHYLSAPGRRITGIDINADFVKTAAARFKGRKDISVMRCDFLKGDKRLKKSSFDTIVMLNVLEHIKDDICALKKAAALLKPGGTLVNLVPAMGFAYGELDRQLGHFRRYQRDTLLELNNAAELKDEKMFYMNFIGAFAWWFNSALLKRKDFPSGQPVVFDRFFVPVLKVMESAVKPPIGQSLVSVSRK